MLNSNIDIYITDIVEYDKFNKNNDIIISNNNELNILSHHLIPDISKKKINFIKNKDILFSNSNKDLSNFNIEKTDNINKTVRLSNDEFNVLSPASIIPIMSKEDITNDMNFINKDISTSNKELSNFSIENTENNNNSNADIIRLRKKKLLEYIKYSKSKINNALYIVSTKYDLVYSKYNKFSLSILIISTIITFIEAFRLTIISYMETGKELLLSQSTINLIINITSLLLGSVLTIISSIVRFRNYRELMEKLKNTQSILFSYKMLYNKQKELVIYFEISNKLTNELFEELFSKFITYNDEIKEINILEDIRTFDIIKLNKIKNNYDIELDKINKNKELELLKNSYDIENKKKNLFKSDKPYITLNDMNSFIFAN